VKQKTDAGVSADPVPKGGVPPCKYAKQKAERPVRKLVELPLPEQLRVVMALHAGTRGGLSPAQAKAVVQAVARYECKVKPRAQIIKETTKQVKEMNKSGKETGKMLTVTLLAPPDGHASVQSLLCLMWESGAGSEERKLLEAILTSPDGFKDQLPQNRRLDLGYDGGTDLIVPDPACSLRSFYKWAIYTVFRVASQDKALVGWEKRYLRDMWKAFNKPPRANFIDALVKMRLYRSFESDYNDDKKKIRMSTIAYRTTYSLSSVWLARKIAGNYLLPDGFNTFAGRANAQPVFYGTALHEIAHAVDDKFKIMNNVGADAGCGGWKTIRTEKELVSSMSSHLTEVCQDDECKRKVAAAQDLKRTQDEWDQRREARTAEMDQKAAQDPDFRAAREQFKADKQLRDTDRMKDEPWAAAQTAWRQAQARANLQNPDPGEKPAGDPALREGNAKADSKERVLGVDDKKLEVLLTAALGGTLPDDIATRPAPLKRMLKQCKKLCRSEGGWGKEFVKLEALEVGGRIFHKSYDGQWGSYLLADKRTRGVTLYQYRAAAEWFAELYAFYHMGQLGGHPLEGWMASVAALTLADPAHPPAVPRPPPPA
jgi:hypothetical protein